MTSTCHDRTSKERTPRSLACYNFLEIHNKEVYTFPSYVWYLLVMLPVHDAFTVLRIFGIKAFVMRWNREKLVLSCQEVEPRVPGLRHQCSITELQQPDNHLADSCCNLIDNPRSCEPCHPHPSARGSSPPRSVYLLLTPSAHYRVNTINPLRGWFVCQCLAVIESVRTLVKSVQ